MDENTMKAELSANIKKNKQTLLEMFQVLDLTELGRDMWNKQQEDITNRLLAEHEFYADSECNRGGVSIKVGDRITAEKWTFLLSNSDFDRLQQLDLVETEKAGITDEQGRYIENWDIKAIEARKELYQFICDNVLPSDMRTKMQVLSWSVTIQDKLIKVIRDAVVPADNGQESVTFK